MNDLLTEFIRTRHIDSCQKLRLLLFLFQEAGGKGTIQEMAQRLYLGHSPLLEEMVTDLQRVGLVTWAEGYYILHDSPDIRSTLECLAKTFEDPLARQEILDLIRRTVSANRYQTGAHQFGWPMSSSFEINFGA